MSSKRRKAQQRKKQHHLKAQKERHESAGGKSNAMSEADTHVRRAMLAFQEKRMTAAEAAAMKALQADPSCVDALHLIAAMAREGGNLPKALTYFEKGIETGKATADLYYDMALSLTDAGKAEDALRAMREAESRGMNQPEMYVRMGAMLQRVGAYADAVQCYDKVLSVNPHDVDALNNKGNALSQLGKHEAGLGCLTEAHQNASSNPQIKYNLATAYQRAGQHEPAINLLKDLLGQQREQPMLLNNLAVAYFETGRIDDAVMTMERALELTPESVDGWLNLARFLEHAGRYEEAESLYRRVIADHEGTAGMLSAVHRLTLMLIDLRRPAEANLICEQALTVTRENADVWYAMGLACEVSGQLDEARTAFEQATQIEPNHVHALARLTMLKRKQCHWDYQEALEHRLLALVDHGVGGFDPLVALNLDADMEQVKRAVDSYVSNRRLSRLSLQARVWEPGDRNKPMSEIGAGMQIKIGYLSADFYTHATAMLIAEMFELHDRERFKVYAYSYSPPRRNDTMLQRLQQGVDQFVDIRALDYQSAADRIAADEIDILIDLKGHTQDARPEIMAYQPAPVGMTYLGFPGPVNMPGVDYALVDSIVAPIEDDVFYNEKLIRLPGCYQINDRQRIVGDMPTREAMGLPDNAFVYASMNNAHKLTPWFFELWLKILTQVPNSVLWLLLEDESARERLRKLAKDSGVDAARLVFADRMAGAAHLGRQSLVDLMLDTLPYNAHTTASDALWAGVPLLTVRGKSFAGRVGCSVLHAVGMDELITDDLAAYEHMAVTLGRDPARVNALHDQLLAMRDGCALFDSVKTTRAIESAYERVWSVFLAGEKPTCLTID